MLRSHQELGMHSKPMLHALETKDIHFDKFEMWYAIRKTTCALPNQDFFLHSITPS